MQHIQNRQWLPENLKKVTLPTPANHCFQIAASYVQRHIYKNKNEIVAKDPFNVGRSYKKGSIYKDEICGCYFQNNNLDRIIHELHCHHPCYKLFTQHYSCKFCKVSPSLVVRLFSNDEFNLQEYGD